MPSLGSHFPQFWPLPNDRSLLHSASIICFPLHPDDDKLSSRFYVHEEMHIFTYKGILQYKTIHISQRKTESATVVYTFRYKHNEELIKFDINSIHFTLSVPVTINIFNLDKTYICKVHNTIHRDYSCKFKSPSKSYFIKFPQGVKMSFTII